MLTPQEHYRLHGSLPGAVIESLLDMHDSLDGLPSDIAGDIGAGFPQEDFMQGAINALREVVTAMRKGERRTELEAIVSRFEDLQLEVARNSEYGLEELAKARKAWAGVPRAS